MKKKAHNKTIMLSTRQNNSNNDYEDLIVSHKRTTTERINTEKKRTDADMIAEEQYMQTGHTTEAQSKEIDHYLRELQGTG